jgi:hypothetical protein
LRIAKSRAAFPAAKSDAKVRAIAGQALLANVVARVEKNCAVWSHRSICRAPRYAEKGFTVERLLTVSNCAKFVGRLAQHLTFFPQGHRMAVRSRKQSA